MLSIRSQVVLTIARVLVISALFLTCGNSRASEEPKYKFESDFTTNHAAVWTTQLAHLAGQPNVKALEVGSYEGRSTIWFLENILTHESATITTIDPYYAKHYRANIEASGVAHKVTSLRSFSEVAMRDLEMHTYDFIYIDGSHHAKDVLIDAVQAWSLIKVDGLIIFDDYTMKSDAWGVPLPAIDAFLDIFGPYIEVVHKSEQVIVRKKVENIDPPPRTWDSSGKMIFRER